MTTVTLIFPIYFITRGRGGPAAGEGREHYAWAFALAVAMVALMAPVLGAMADRAGIKKKMLAGFMLFGVTATACPVLRRPGRPGAGSRSCSCSANIGIDASFVFYESLLPHIAGEEEIDRVSSAGYALGLPRRRPDPRRQPRCGSAIRERFGFPDAGVATRCPSSAPRSGGCSSPSRCSSACPSRRTGRYGPDVPPRHPCASPPPSCRDAPRPARLSARPSCSWSRSSSTTTASRPSSGWPRSTGREIGHLRQSALIGALVIVQFVGVPFAFLFGALASADRGRSRSIFIALAVYAGITVFALPHDDRGRVLRAGVRWWAWCRAAPRRSAARCSRP